ncbi:MAG: ComF family protein [Deltaproteobacteria bacterium]|nr:ComF family protein [Deltaproteobacteria bacterium]
MKKILAGLADIIFPRRCLSCDNLLIHEGDGPFCLDCFNRIGFVRSPLCIKCGVPFKGVDQKDHLCGECLTSKQGFTIARTVGRYETTLLNCIHRFKYQEDIGAGKILGKLMAAYDYPGLKISDYTLIIPVPLHAKRLRERGFNQSLILAGEIAGTHGLPVDFMTLKRHVYTVPQVSIGKKEREANVKGSFGVAETAQIKGEKIILVDDVYTTGSTIKECAKVLMREGAKEVAVLTLARAV